MTVQQTLSYVLYTHWDYGSFPIGEPRCPIGLGLHADRRQGPSKDAEADFLCSIAIKRCYSNSPGNAGPRLSLLFVTLVIELSVRV
jgi:hypothetical protein